MECPLPDSNVAFRVHTRIENAMVGPTGRQRLLIWKSAFMNRSFFFALTLLSVLKLPIFATPDEKLHALGISLPAKSPAVANYVSAVRTGNMVFLSGHLPYGPDGQLITGHLGKDLTVEEGQAAARQVGISLLATLKSELGDLSRVRRIVKLFGMVSATPDFTAHSLVINGCSDLMVEVFGEQGRHARAACGFSSLPLGAAVEIELIVEIAD
jgi:enamine deaminase RidA (YjgF/YER057c/UK114 family)